MEHIEQRPETARAGLIAVTRSDEKIVAGVAGGIADRIGLDPFVVRAGFVVLAAAGGVGLLAYLLLWVITGDPETSTTSAAKRKPAFVQIVAAILILLGSLVVLRSLGLWFGDEIVWPIALGAFGSAVIWARSDEAERARWSRAARFPGVAFSGRVSRGRVALGAVLVAAGMGLFLATNNAFGEARTIVGVVRNLLFAMVVTALGLGLVLGPWVARLARQSVEERRERIRPQERAEMAAHLHDSVLQTLALIQRSGSAREMSSLARVQERELRSWLYGRQTQDGHNLSTAMDEAASRVERAHHVPIETVVVGDCSLDERTRGLVAACKEAMSNAAKHSGAGSVSLYVEVEDDTIHAYVRDQGAGFDTSLVAEDRRGISDSIVGRIRRLGGTATVNSSPGQGAEVEIQLPRTSA
jgi:signal transduction histidine kinase